jgi:hypothetical protein
VGSWVWLPHMCCETKFESFLCLGAVFGTHFNYNSIVWVWVGLEESYVQLV